jgi:hypothetical protein
MNLSALRRKSPVPLLVLVALALVVITLVSPQPDRADRSAFAAVADQPDPPAPPARRKRSVPVRAASTSDTGGKPTDRVALRQLVVAASAEDAELATWKVVLDRIGTPYDVLLARSEPLRADRLVRADGSGRYNAVLLTNNALLYPDGKGNYTSGFDPGEWQALWDYERAFGVRQVSLDTSLDPSPEDYCLRSGREGATGATPTAVTMTGAGGRIFDYLNPDARIPVAQSYLHRARLAPGCTAEPVLRDGDDVLGVLSPSADGRERLALSFSSNENLLQTDLLGYGLLRWATKGVFLGEQRHWLNVDVDDWFNTTARLRPDGRTDSFRLTGQEAAAVSRQQTDLREAFPQAAGFTLNLPYNGSKIDQDAPAQCRNEHTSDPLTSFSKCLADRFRWVNHTMTHPQMNYTSYEQSLVEIKANLGAAATAGLPVPTTVLKTPEYSGLGIYSASPTSLVPSTDNGLAASNRGLLKAASELGVKYLQGNMSFASHRPSCFNCGIYHPLQPDLLLVPDWPTNIAFEATTPDEQTAVYNSQYGAKSAPGQVDRDYAAIIDAESEVALKHLVQGSVYTHTLHQGNLHQYDSGHSLAFDWLRALVAKYAAYYRVPLENPDWRELAGYAQTRTGHFATVAEGKDAVWNHATNAITYHPDRDSSLFVTGVATRPASEQDASSGDDSRAYGSDTVSQVAFTGGGTVVLTASPRA